jgi:hypoxanthine-guanine phosphoribosyltransferase
MPWHPQAPPKKLPIDLAVVDTADGRWLVAIETITETGGTANLLLGIILEQSIDNERMIQLVNHEARRKTWIRPQRSS